MGLPCLACFFENEKTAYYPTLDSANATSSNAR
jgi:hypothetical protein